MSIQTMKKEIIELKRTAAEKIKHTEDSRIKNLNDEELQSEINLELEKLGFKSEEDLHEVARKYFSEHGLRPEFNNPFDFQDYVFEHLSDIVESREVKI